MGKQVKILYLFLGICFISMVSATTFGYNYLDNKELGNVTKIYNYTYNNYTVNGTTFNDTMFEYSGETLNIKISWLTSFIDSWFGEKTTDNLTEGSVNLYDNQSWNEVYARTLFADISSSSDNSSWNETYANTLYAPINYGDDWNKTYADTLYADISVVDTDTNAATICSSTEVLLGNGSCLDSDTFFDNIDTTYTAGSNLTLAGTEFSVNVTGLQEFFDSIYQPLGSYLSTAVESLTGSNDYIILNDSSGNILITFNDTKLNETILLLAPTADSNIYKIYFNSSIKNVITYNLTESDASIISLSTIGGQKIIYGGDFA